MIICGIDPGITGAIAFIATNDLDRVSVEDLPIAGGEINVRELVDIFKTWRPTFVMLEQAQSMPKQGVKGVFNYGRCYGDLRGTVCALELPLYLVRPNLWKKHFGLPADKDICRLRAIRYFPACADHFKLKKHHNRAEAALLALYGVQTKVRHAPDL